MSEACTHDCGNCSSDCGERTAPQSLNNANNKGVKKVIAVVSGKGGVGKSLVTSMLAVSAAKKGLKTAILDADIQVRLFRSLSACMKRQPAMRRER